MTVKHFNTDSSYLIILLLTTNWKVIMIKTQVETQGSIRCKQRKSIKLNIIKSWGKIRSALVIN